MGRPPKRYKDVYDTKVEQGIATGLDDEQIQELTGKPIEHIEQVRATLDRLVSKRERDIQV